MQDRVPLYPGRVTLTPVAGQANTYDMARADQPTQEGTPLNKATLLKDVTASILDLPNTAVPDDAFAKIKDLIDIATNSANSKAQITTGSYVGTGTYGANNPNSLTFNFAPKIVLIYTNYGIVTNEGEWKNCLIWAKNVVSVTGVGKNSITFAEILNGIKWYSDANTPIYAAQAQCNTQRTTYYWIAIA